MADDHRIPIHDVLPNVSLSRLDDDTVADFVFVLVKTVAHDGHSSWAFRTSREVDIPEELLGALEVQAELVKRSLLAQWEIFA